MYSHCGCCKMIWIAENPQTSDKVVSLPHQGGGNPTLDILIYLGV